MNRQIQKQQLLGNGGGWGEGETSLKRYLVGVGQVLDDSDLFFILGLHTEHFLPLMQKQTKVIGQEAFPRGPPTQRRRDGDPAWRHLPVEADRGNREAGGDQT